jgi:hypothetical protein
MSSTTRLRETLEDQAVSSRVDSLRHKAVSANAKDRFAERYYLLEQAYLRHKDEPHAIRHAHMTSAILSGISIVVDGVWLDLIARNHRFRPEVGDQVALEREYCRNLPEILPGEGCVSEKNTWRPARKRV